MLLLMNILKNIHHVSTCQIGCLTRLTIGDVFDNNNHKIGNIDSCGTVRDKNNHTIGHASGVDRVYAAVFFFFEFD